MRRFLATTALLVVTAFLLNGCTSSPLPAESQEVTNVLQSEEPAETNSPDISNDLSFEFTRADFVESLRKAFNALPEGFDVPNAFETEPSVMESLGCTVFTYKVDVCTEVVIYAHPKTDNIVRFIIRSSSNKMEEENATTFGTYSAFITGVFAAKDELEEMDKALAISDTPYTQNTVNFFHGENAEFSYTITDGLLSVRISPAN